MESARDVQVEPLAVLQEVGVAVLIAGAADQHRVLLSHPLGPVEAIRRGSRCPVDDGVAGVTTGAEHDGVPELVGIDLGVEQVSVEGGREVGGEGVVGTEVTRQVDEVVVAAKERSLQGRCPPRRAEWLA